MLHPENRIKWIDVDSQKVDKAPIEDLFQKYSYKMEERDGGYYIDFRELNVKVQDHTGWTQLLSMRKTAGALEWIEISGVLASGCFTAFMISDSTLIPVYDLSKSSIGFHGELKYPFIVKKLSDIHTDDRVKIKNDGKTSYLPLYLLDEYVDKEGVDPIHGYQLETKSKMFTISGLQLWGDYTIPEDYCAACPVHGTQNCSGCRKGGK